MGHFVSEERRGVFLVLMRSLRVLFKQLRKTEVFGFTVMYKKGKNISGGTLAST